MQPNRTVLEVSPFPAGSSELSEILRNSPWTLTSCRTCAEAISFLKRKIAPVVVCERDLPDGSWQDILDRTSRAANPTAVIVASRVADERLWVDVLERGGYNVWLKPFDPREALRDLTEAWQRWNERQGRRVMHAGSVIHLDM